MSKAVLIACVLFGLIFIGLAVLPSIMPSNGGNWFEPKFTVSGKVRFDLPALSNIPDVVLEEVSVQKQWLPFALTPTIFAIGGVSGERTIISIGGSSMDAGNWSAGGLGASESEWRKSFSLGNIPAGNAVLKVDLYKQGVIYNSQSFNVLVS